MERKAVLFDLDDTLYPEFDYVRGGFRAVASLIERRLGADAERTYTMFMEILEEQGRGKIFNRWLEETGTGPSITVDEMVREYRGHIPEIALFPDVAPALSGLKASGCATGIITDGNLVVQTRKVEALGLEGMVDIVVFTDEKGIAYWKPNPAVFEDTIRLLHAVPGRSVYVGNDPSKDFTGPRVIGMHTIHLQRGAGREHACDAEHHMNGLDRLEEWAEEHLHAVHPS